MIYDCFTFNDEFDVLRIRLEELNDVVDRFVLVESKYTFQGDEKPFNFATNKKLFEPWLDKIRTVRVGVRHADPWAAEVHQRNAIHQGVRYAGADDTIIISDVDEIPRAGIVAQGACNAQPLSLVNTTYYYALDLEVPWVHYRYPIMTPRWRLNLNTPQALREQGGMGLSNAGWHFSCLGGAGAIQKKLQSFAHSEHRDVPLEHIERSVATGTDFLGRGDLKPVDIDATFPQYVQEHQHDTLAHLTRRGMGIDAQ